MPTLPACNSLPVPSGPPPASPNHSPPDRAAARIAESVAAEGTDAALRVAVLAGGCSGFQYRFELDPAQQDDDLVIERAGARVLVDPVSLDLLSGARTGLHRRADGQPLSVRNPNAKSACGCGTSFSVD